MWVFWLAVGHVVVCLLWLAIAVVALRDNSRLHRNVPRRAVAKRAPPSAQTANLWLTYLCVNGGNLYPNKVQGLVAQTGRSARFRRPSGTTAGGAVLRYR